jgi:outer membrane protein OmpA-like peptidoglycan-associated protein
LDQSSEFRWLFALIQPAQEIFEKVLLMISSAPIRTALAATAAIALFSGSTALAQQQPSSSTRFFQGLYLQGGIGAHSSQDADLGSPASVDVDTDADFASHVALGLELGDTGFRVEIEGAYRPSEVDSISGASGSSSGDVDTISALLNGFFDIGVSDRIDLSIGGGIGIANVDYDGVTPVGSSSINDDDWGLAWQLGAGAAYALNDRLKLALDYRYLNVEDLDFPTSPNIGGVDADYEDHAVFIGLRFLLNEPLKAPPAPKPAPKPVAQPAAPAPAPAPPPPPAPEPTREFIVFFDWDQSVITPEAAAILRDAASTAQTLAPVRIVAVGHADRSGSTTYNQGLSERRAKAVQDQLQQFGINPSTVGTSGRGEEDPLVPTPDGVREPQNRRVEIEIQ